MAVLAGLASPPSAYAFKTGGHWALAQKVMHELPKGNRIRTAMERQPACLAWGSNGPDLPCSDPNVLVDLIPWFDVYHYDRCGSYARELMKRALADNDERGIAFAAGWITHVAGDLAIHGNLVNPESGIYIETGEEEHNLHGDLEGWAEPIVWSDPEFGGLPAQDYAPYTDDPSDVESTKLYNYFVRFKDRELMDLPYSTLPEDACLERLIDTTNKSVIFSEGVPCFLNQYYFGYKAMQKDALLFGTVMYLKKNVFRTWLGPVIGWVDIGAMRDEKIKVYRPYDSSLAALGGRDGIRFKRLEKAWREARDLGVGLLEDASRGDYSAYSDSWILDAGLDDGRPMGSLQVYVQTGWDSSGFLGWDGAGTSEDVYFGIEYEDGVKHRWTLNHRAMVGPDSAHLDVYNDFETGDLDVYYLQWPKFPAGQADYRRNPANIRHVWLGLSNYWGKSLGDWNMWSWGMMINGVKVFQDAGWNHWTAPGTQRDYFHYPNGSHPSLGDWSYMRTDPRFVPMSTPKPPTVSANPQWTRGDPINVSIGWQDPTVAVRQYYYSLGTSPGTTDLGSWSTCGSNLVIGGYTYGLMIAPDSGFYVNVKARDAANRWTPVASCRIVPRPLTAAPVVSVATQTVTIRSGDTLNLRYTINDTDSTSWQVTRDYGDGCPTDGDASYDPRSSRSVVHRYMVPGEYRGWINAKDASGARGWTGFTVVVVPTPSLAGADTFGVAEDKSLRVAVPGVLANDEDLSGGHARPVLDKQAGHGTVVLSGSGAFSYQPQANYNGTDTFTYVLDDGTLVSRPATVSIRVSPLLDAPDVRNDSFSTRMNTALTVGRPGVLGNDKDLDGFGLRAAVASQPARGSLDLRPDGSLTYVPGTGWTGFDSFSYRAVDATGVAPLGRYVYPQGWHRLCYPLDAAVSETLLCAVGPSSSNEAMLAVIDVSDPASPTPRGSLVQRSDSFTCVDVAGPFAYLGAGDGLRVVDLSDPTKPIQVGSCPLDLVIRDVDVAGARAYVIGSRDIYEPRGWVTHQVLEVVDVSDAAHPARVGSYVAPEGSSGYAEHLYRGISVAGSRVYVADRPEYRPGAVRIFDASDPSNPSLAGSYPLASGPLSYRSGILAPEGGYVYVADGTHLRVIDVADSAHPRLAGSIAYAKNIELLDVSDLYAYLTVFISPNWSLEVVDLADPAHPTVAFSYPYSYEYDSREWPQMDGLVRSKDCAYGFSHSGTSRGSAIFQVLDVPKRALATVTVNVHQPDSTPPSTSISGVPSGWSTANVTFSLDATDEVGGSGVKETYYILDGAAQTSYKAPVALTAEGQHIMSYWSVDWDNNAERARSRTIRIDKTPPTTTSDAQNRYWGTAAIHLSAVDQVSGVSGTFYVLDGGPTTSGTVIRPGVGTHVLEYWSVDGAGNVEEPNIVPVEVRPTDTIPPVTAISEVPEGWSRTDVIIRLMARDNEGGSGVGATYYEFGGIGQAVYSRPVTLTADGATAFSFWSTDRAGNAGERQTKIVRIDRTPPSLSCDAKATYERTATINIVAQDGASGVKSVHYRLDGGSWQTGTLVTTSVVAAHTLEFYAGDVAGNVAATQRVDFRVIAPPQDTTPPRPVSNFRAIPGDGRVVLSWTNPADSDFRLVRILRSTTGPAATPTPGSGYATAYEGASGAATDTAVANGVTYHYTAFTCDTAGNWGAPVTGSATPRALPQPLKRATLGRLTVPRRIYRRKYFVLAGTLKPAHTASTRVTVYFFRKSGRRWLRYKAVPVKLGARATTYRLRYRLPYRGYWYACATHKCTGHLASASAKRYFWVK